MGSAHNNAIAERFEQIKSARHGIINPNKNTDNLNVKIEEIKLHLDSDLLRPATPTWEQVREAVSPLINAPGYLEMRRQSGMRRWLYG